MPDRWSSLMHHAAEAPDYRQAFYRWIDLIERPVNPEEYHRGRDVFLVWENADGKWVVQGGSGGASAKTQRLFDTKEEACTALEAEGCSFVRTRKVNEPALSKGSFDRLLIWAVAAAVLVVAASLLMYATTRESALQRAHHVCGECGLRADTIDGLIDTAVASDNSEQELLAELGREVTVETGSGAPSAACMQAVLRAAGR